MILISLDTLRADHLGCYGYSRVTSLVIDLLAAEGVLFENCLAQAPATTPSHMSIMTSLYPSAHGLLGDTLKKKLDSTLSLAAYLRTLGYSTAAFTAGGMVSSDFGFDNGFDMYREEEILSKEFEEQINREEAESMFEWIRQNKERPFFLFFHSYIVHDPYTPRAPYDSLFDPGYSGDLKQPRELLKAGDEVKWSDHVPHLMALYDGEIRQADEFIGLFVEKLKSLNLWDRSIIILTSDHGEEFLEHGGISHVQLYNEVVNVPLIIVAPGLLSPNKRIDAVVRSIDIFPTIADLLKEPIPQGLQGQSLIPIIRERASKLVAFSEMRYTLGRYNRSLLAGKWKVIERSTSNGNEPVRELYNVEEDPYERNNVASMNEDILQELMEEIENISKNNSEILAQQVGSDKATLQLETIEKLKALGYLQ